MKRIVIVIVASLLTTVVVANACSAVACLDHGDEMRTAFAVKITHGGKPLAGVLVDAVTQPNNKKLFSDVTGADGTVYVTNLPAGEYWLKAEYFGVLATYQCFHIENHSSRKAKRRLTFQWGDLVPATRRVVGKFIDSQPGESGTPLWNMTHRVEVPVQGASLLLKNVLTGLGYTVTSNDEGEFAFPTLPKGTYVLHLDGGTVGTNRGYDAADILIDVSPNTPNNAVRLTNREAGGGSCGGISLEVLSASR